MKLQYAYPLSTYYSAYIDPKKSVPHYDKGKLVNEKGLAWWIPEERYLVDLDDYLKAIEELKLETYEIINPASNKTLAEFEVVKGKSAIWDGEEGNGMVAFRYSSELLAYRRREDGLLGLEAIGGLVDTRLSKKEKEKFPGRFPADIKATTPQEANFSSLKTIKDK
jgi:hypothetical protein